MEHPHVGREKSGGGPTSAALFRALSENTAWEPVGEIKLQFRTYHPQGMMKIGDTFFISSVHSFAIDHGDNGSRKQNQKWGDEGEGYLFKADLSGRLIEVTRLCEGPIYHPGGIDFDGNWIWVPVAEYRPDSSSIIFRVDPETLEAGAVFRVDDHVGDLSYSRSDNKLYGFSWGSRRLYAWQIENGSVLSPMGQVAEIDRPRTVRDVEFQDCHYVDSSHVLCSSTTHFKQSYFGSLDLVDLQNGKVVHQLLVHLAPKDSDRPMTHNPMCFERIDDRLRFYFAPEDDQTTIYVFDALLQCEI